MPHGPDLISATTISTGIGMALAVLAASRERSLRARIAGVNEEVRRIRDEQGLHPSHESVVRLHRTRRQCDALGRSLGHARQAAILSLLATGFGALATALALGNASTHAVGALLMPWATFSALASVRYVSDALRVWRLRDHRRLVARAEPADPAIGH